MKGPQRETWAAVKRGAFPLHSRARRPRQPARTRGAGGWSVVLPNRSLQPQPVQAARPAAAAGGACGPAKAGRTDNNCYRSFWPLLARRAAGAGRSARSAGAAMPQRSERSEGSAAERSPAAGPAGRGVGERESCGHCRRQEMHERAGGRGSAGATAARDTRSDSRCSIFCGRRVSAGRVEAGVTASAGPPSAA